MRNLDRRQFLNTAGVLTAGTLLSNPLQTFGNKSQTKMKLALAGTGIRGTSFWGKAIVERYPDVTEFVALFDHNPGRLEFAKQFMGIECPVFSDFEAMINQTKPDYVIVTTVDATHHLFIIKALEMGCNVITEKPMTTDEGKCQAILDAERKTGRKVIVGFNYRYGLQFTKLKELLVKQEAGRLTSVDFHWYLNTYHGASYFRRWHGERDKSGTLLLHKATHHFDLLNWWIDSDPMEVVAFGALEHYGKNNAFRGENCRSCPHTKECKFYWDIMAEPHMVDLYVKNEKYDGYIRDNCLWRDRIDIYDKMAVQIKYANNVQVSYSLTTYSPYEGWRIAFNGMDGRIDSWEGIPWETEKLVSQSQLHAAEMSQKGAEEPEEYDEIMVMKNWQDYNLVKVPRVRSGHGGGDVRLHDKIFKDPNMADPYKHSAGTRDGAMSILIGIAARKSIEEGRMVKIEELTDLPILAVRP
ncbi:Gfo/Idh/MocA family protein [Mangrovibacterium diazotrophicum]|uniref:Oxidoreductase family protein n=1 Tax=Mangrovibacterium diazotrophicum TaxID=1261403 RepID=A0A419W9Y4_9BACT|nr:Gfo/Idh/MocA family oxidoreductase [Mangrovibacterium diazotrophicum]RKD92290.1 oxidoreductase family protein [Mangrovibacterium diazotrophicum]